MAALLTALLLVALSVRPSPALVAPVPLRRGWNLGDTLETGHGLKGVNGEWVFESVQAAGFDWVRIPCQWDYYTAKSAPYAIDPKFMAQVNTTVGWALKHGLRAMINTHHENDWVESKTDPTKFAKALPRLVAIWRQMAEHFAAIPDDQLVFEIFNEPLDMTVAQLNTMNAAVLPVIRATNPTRQVHLGGLEQMGTWWILANPDAMVFDPKDDHLALTVHSYNPWPFAGSSGPPPTHAPTVHTFTPKDIADAGARPSSFGNFRSFPLSIHSWNFLRSRMRRAYDGGAQEMERHPPQHPSDPRRDVSKKRSF